MMNHLITSFRFLRKRAVYTTINLSGLVLGLSAAFMLLIVTINNLTFNTTLPNHHLLYRVLLNDKKSNISEALTPAALSGLFQLHVPIIEKTALTIRMSNLSEVGVAKNGAYNLEAGFVCMNREGIELLGIDLLDPPKSVLLEDSLSIAVSEETARRYFGSGTVTGRNLMLNIGGAIFQVKVVATFRNTPWNSTFSADFIAGMPLFLHVMSALGEQPDQILRSFSFNYFETYIKMRAGATHADLVKQLTLLNGLPEIRKQSVFFCIQPVSDIYLQSDHIKNDFAKRGSNDDIYIYLSLAIFILFLAGVNYSILSTARSALRFREIGIRKVMGATRGNLRMQILTESVFLTFVALPLSLLFIGLIYPFLVPHFGPEIGLYVVNLKYYLPLFFIITIIIGILSGSYVAIFLASMDPMEALKAKFFSFKKFSASRIFIVFQLFLTITMLIGLISVYRQINLCLAQSNLQHGENILIIKYEPGTFQSTDQFKQDLTAVDGIKEISATSINLPGGGASLRKVKIEGPPAQEVTLEIIYIDSNFFNTMNIPFYQGNDLTLKGPSDVGRSAYLNNPGVKTVGFGQPVGAKIGQLTVQGVVHDFNFHTIHSAVNPTLFIYNPAACQTIICRFNSREEKGVIAAVHDVCKRHTPGQKPKISLYDNQQKQLYEREQNFGRIVGAFTLLAFIITGMGLFGLAMLLSERRMKEMAIRKIYGASNTHILYEMQKEFFIYIGLATVLAIPFSWWLMEKWLEEFYLRIELNWITFIGSTLAVAVFVSVTLLARTVKVIREDPVNTLKYE